MSPQCFYPTHQILALWFLKLTLLSTKQWGSSPPKDSINCLISLGEISPHWVINLQFDHLNFMDLITFHECLAPRLSAKHVGTYFSYFTWLNWLTLDRRWKEKKAPAFCKNLINACLNGGGITTGPLALQCEHSHTTVSTPFSNFMLYIVHFYVIELPERPRNMGLDYSHCYCRSLKFKLRRLYHSLIRV